MQTSGPIFINVELDDNSDGEILRSKICNLDGVGGGGGGGADILNFDFLTESGLQVKKKLRKKERQIR